MPASPGQRVLGITFLLTLAFCLLEFIGGKLSGSIALVADSAHMLTDLGALGLALFAARLQSKRAEIVAASINGMAMLVLAAFILFESLRRFHYVERDIDVAVMLAITLAGLLFNLFSAVLLHRPAQCNINVRAAFFHVIGDTLSSVGTLIAGIIVWQTGWQKADPLIGLFIAALITLSALWLLKDVVKSLFRA